MKDAMRAKETVRLGTIRMLIAAIKKHEIDNQATLDDAGTLKIIQKQIKQRRDSITQFEAAGRTELAEKEHIEELQAIGGWDAVDKNWIQTIENGLGKLNVSRGIEEE